MDSLGLELEGLGFRREQPGIPTGLGLEGLNLKCRGGMVDGFDER